MPDASKLRALRSAEFKVVPTCSTCVHFRRGSRAAWGHCSAIVYVHGKHSPPEGVSKEEHKKFKGTMSQAPRKTGVPNNGWCPQYELSEVDLEDHVQSYVEFYVDVEEEA
jgi:hypothetical protein